jgi:hypothetical protein
MIFAIETGSIKGCPAGNLTKKERARSITNEYAHPAAGPETTRLRPRPAPTQPHQAGKSAVKTGRTGTNPDGIRPAAFHSHANPNGPLRPQLLRRTGAYEAQAGLPQTPSFCLTVSFSLPKSAMGLSGPSAGTRFPYSLHACEPIITVGGNSHTRLAHAPALTSRWFLARAR